MNSSLQAQTQAFLDALRDGNKSIGPAGLKRDDSLAFVNECLLPPRIPVFLMMTADEAYDEGWI